MNIRQKALEQTQFVLERVESIKEVFLAPTSFESINEFPAAIVHIGQDVNAIYVGHQGFDKEIFGSIEVMLMVRRHDETTIQDLLEVFDEVETQWDTDVSTFLELTPAIYPTTPIHLAEDPVIDVNREIAAVLCRFEYHNGN